MKPLTIEQKYELSNSAKAGYGLLVICIPTLILMILVPASAGLFVFITTFATILIAYHEWSRRVYRIEFARIEVKRAYEEYINALRHEKQLLENRTEELEALEKFMNGVMP